MWRGSNHGNSFRRFVIVLFTWYTLQFWRVKSPLLTIQSNIGSKYVTPPKHPHRLWKPPSLLRNVYWGPFPRDLSGRSEKLSIYFHILTRFKNVWSIFLLCFHSLRAGWSGDRILVGARFPLPVQTDPGANPTCSLSRVQSGRGAALTTHPHLAPRFKKGYSPSGPSWPVLGRNLPFLLYISTALYSFIA
jgi:hypothetical protein